MKSISVALFFCDFFSYDGGKVIQFPVDCNTIFPSAFTIDDIFTLIQLMKMQGSFFELLRSETTRRREECLHLLFSRFLVPLVTDDDFPKFLVVHFVFLLLVLSESHCRSIYRRFIHYPCRDTGTIIIDARSG